MEAWCNCYNAMTFPCRLLNGECEFMTEAIPDSSTRALIELLPTDMLGFLSTDLDAVLEGLAPDLLMRLHEFQDAELRKIQKAALLDAWADHILDSEAATTLPDTWDSKKAACLSACLEVGGMGPGLVAPEIMILKDGK